MSMFIGREAVHGDCRVRNERKNRNSLKYWFHLHVGMNRNGKEKWVVFDVRDLAQRANTEEPELMTLEELCACRDHTNDFENLLKRDLSRIAEFCYKVGAVQLLTTKQKEAA